MDQLRGGNRANSGPTSKRTHNVDYTVVYRAPDPQSQRHKKRGHTQKHTPLEKKVLIMKLKLMVATVKTSRKTKTSVGSLWVSTAPLGLT